MMSLILAIGKKYIHLKVSTSMRWKERYVEAKNEVEARPSLYTNRFLSTNHLGLKAATEISFDV